MPVIYTNQHYVSGIYEILELPLELLEWTFMALTWHKSWANWHACSKNEAHGGEMEGGFEEKKEFIIDAFSFCRLQRQSKEHLSDSPSPYTILGEKEPNIK